MVRPLSALLLVSLVACSAHRAPTSEDAPVSITSSASTPETEPEPQAAAEEGEVAVTTRNTRSEAKAKGRSTVAKKAERQKDVGGLDTLGYLDALMGGVAAHNIMRGPAEPSEPMPVPVLPATTEHYTDYGVNGFFHTAEDRLSTFAVDVDTASYTISRRKLREGYLPPQSAVRVEEFVNYLPYDYRPPSAGHPFAVDVEASPSPFTEGHHLVRVGVQGKRVSSDVRKDAHLTFLIDTSCSMRSHDKLDLVKSSLTALTENLDDGDTVAIATYAGSTRLVLPPTPATDKRKIIGSLDGLFASGGTAMASGMQLAYDAADKAFVDGDINRVIVASDGDANIGASSHGPISQAIKATPGRASRSPRSDSETATTRTR